MIEICSDIVTLINVSLVIFYARDMKRALSVLALLKYFVVVLNFLHGNSTYKQKLGLLVKNIHGVLVCPKYKLSPDRI
jgi:hypothetical protein